MNTLEKALNVGLFISAIVGTVFVVGIVALVGYGIYNQIFNEPTVTQVTENCVLIRHGPFKDVRCNSNVHNVNAVDAGKQ